MLLCWNNEPLFQRLNSVLCISPLGTTMLAALYSKDVLQQFRINRLVLTATLLLIAALSSISKVELARPITSRFSSLQHICLLSLSLVYAWEVFGLFNDGVEGYLHVDSEDVSNGTNILLQFLAIDKITISLLMLFIMVFFDGNFKRVS